VDEPTITTIDNLKLLYQEIVEGCSLSDDRSVCFKHLNEIEGIEVLRQRLVFFRKYIAKGIPSEKSRLKEVIESEQWSAQKEDDIISLKYAIGDNEKNIVNIIAQQQAMIRRAIEEDKNKLGALLLERSQVLGVTADELSDTDASNYTLYLSAYKDRACTTRMFSSWEEFESMSNEELDQLVNMMESCMSKFSDKNIRELSVLPHFLNSFSYCKDRIEAFLNKPVSIMTGYQMHLLSLGVRNLNILSQSQGSPPELLGDTSPEQIIKWYDLQFSIILGKRNSAK
jgi:hypothetical protein